MKLNIEESTIYTQTEVLLRCKKVDNEIKPLIDYIKAYDFTIKCRNNNKTYLIKPTEIFYIESIDDKTFVYCKDEVYSCDMRLYVLESKLSQGVFIRVSKSCLLNISLIKGFRSLINGKLEAEMTNGERIIVSRHYVQSLKKKLTEMEGKK